MEFQLLTNSPVNDADILILPVPWEKTVCYKHGTALAPAAILEVTDQLEYYEEDIAWSPMKYMQVCVLESVAPHKDEIQFHANLINIVNKLPTDNLFIALGGEHSITPSLIKGRMPKNGSVIYLDAHADLRQSYQGSEYSHACAAYQILSQEHSLIMVGIRSVFEPEVQYLSEITTFMDRGLNIEQVIKCINELTGPVWLTIDMDVFDPALVPGVGTPQPGGINWYQCLDILEAVFFNKNIELYGMDIVELIPEPSHVSETIAAKLMQKAISFWGKAKGFDHRKQNGSQIIMDNK
ncbi:agmatinase [Candidatus Halobeggiatoa sp. HSG11]|nr:agmatinase [Candidatus Halobeggiatoa sp. HSG11]